MQQTSRNADAAAAVLFKNLKAKVALEKWVFWPWGLFKLQPEVSRRQIWGGVHSAKNRLGRSFTPAGGGWRLRLPIPPRENSLISLGEETVSQGSNHSWVIGFRSSVSTSKKLNNNQSNRRSAVQWYFPLQCKWVFSSPLVPGYWIKSHQGSWYPEETHF